MEESNTAAEDTVPEHMEENVDIEDLSVPPPAKSRSASIVAADITTESFLDDPEPGEEDIQVEEVIDPDVQNEEHDLENDDDEGTRSEHENEPASETEVKAEPEMEDPEAEAEVEMAVASDGEQSSRTDGQTVQMLSLMQPDS